MCIGHEIYVKKFEPWAQSNTDSTVNVFRGKHCACHAPTALNGYTVQFSSFIHLIYIHCSTLKAHSI